MAPSELGPGFRRGEFAALLGGTIRSFITTQAGRSLGSIKKRQDRLPVDVIPTSFPLGLEDDPLRQEVFQDSRLRRKYLLHLFPTRDYTVRTNVVSDSLGISTWRKPPRRQGDWIVG